MIIKLLTTFACILLTIYVTAIPYENEYGPEYGDEWIMFVDEDGNNHVMNLSTIPNDTRTLVLGDAYFYLYTRHNAEPEELQVPMNGQVFTSENFNASNLIKVATHGWLGSSNNIWLQSLKDEFLVKDDFNVILIDWHEISQNPIYPWAAFSTRYVGKQTAKLLDSLAAAYQIDGTHMHLIGHSLGSQVMGYTGTFSKQSIARITAEEIIYLILFHDNMTDMWRSQKTVDNVYSFKQLLTRDVSLIYQQLGIINTPGLDPARPFFELPMMPVEDRLDKSDAEFVDIIHTCGGVYGYLKSHGHADFYPNNGRPRQPGCTGAQQMFEGCSHGRSCLFFIESINSDALFYAYPCASWKEFEAGGCTENTTYMGYPANREDSGDYYLYTKDRQPFAQT